VATRPTTLPPMLEPSTSTNPIKVAIVMLALLPLFLAFAPPDPNYLQASDELDAALDTLGTEDTDTAQSKQAIQKAIDLLTQYPDEISTHARTQNQLTEARLSLVWLHLADGNEDAAREAMDEAIRSAQGRALPAGKFGPEVLRLHEDRTRAFEDRGTATIEVDCGVRPCDMLVDETRSPNPSEPLYLGRYRVWVGAQDGDRDWEFFEVDLDEAGETQRILYQAGIPEPVLPASEPVLPASEPASKTIGGVALPAFKPKRNRMLPRWVSIVGLSAGAGLLVAGAVLPSLHGDCTNGADPTDASTCPNIYKTSDAAFYALIGSGAGILALSGIMLTFDEVGVGRSKGQQAVLTWSFRF
jgi:hypothetical protein